MSNYRAVVVLVLLLSLVAPCFAHHIAVVVNKNNKVQNVTSSQLSRIFKFETRKWPDGTDVVLVLHKSSPDDVATLEKVNKMTPAEVRAFLAAHRDDIRMVDSDADIIDMVAATPGAVGLVEARSITDRVSVVKVDGKLPLEAGYLPH